MQKKITSIGFRLQMGQNRKDGISQMTEPTATQS